MTPRAWRVQGLGNPAAETARCNAAFAEFELQTELASNCLGLLALEDDPDTRRETGRIMQLHRERAKRALRVACPWLGAS